jgi:Concanavalin A-like lectin/glucanases superfamily
MSTSLIVLIPVVLLGLVTALCFVGCVFQTGGIGPNLGPYGKAITSNTSLIAFWPLDDQVPTDNSTPVAHDFASHPVGVMPFDGTYTGTFTLQRQGIVPGDTQNNDLNPCASFNGGRVEVRFHPELNPGKTTFTLEAWVKPTWGAGPPGAQNAVVVSANGDPTVNAGYALIATPDNFWEANLGLGPNAPAATPFLVTKSDQQIVTTGASYVAMTYDGTALKLFVGVVGGTFTPKSTPLPPNSNYQPEQPTTATPLFIAMGRPDLPTSGQNPFNGFIQDVAFYSPALLDDEVQSHFALGG